jgi:hypothetical protein
MEDNLYIEPSEIEDQMWRSGISAAIENINQNIGWMINRKMLIYYQIIE